MTITHQTSFTLSSYFFGFRGLGHGGGLLHFSGSDEWQFDRWRDPKIRNLKVVNLEMTSVLISDQTVALRIETLMERDSV